MKYTRNPKKGQNRDYKQHPTRHDRRSEQISISAPNLLRVSDIKNYLIGQSLSDLGFLHAMVQNDVSIVGRRGDMEPAVAGTIWVDRPLPNSTAQSILSKLNFLQGRSLFFQDTPSGLLLRRPFGLRGLFIIGARQLRVRCG